MIVRYLRTGPFVAQQYLKFAVLPFWLCMNPQHLYWVLPGCGRKNNNNMRDVITVGQIIDLKLGWIMPSPAGQHFVWSDLITIIRTIWLSCLTPILISSHSQQHTGYTIFLFLNCSVLFFFPKCRQGPKFTEQRSLITYLFFFFFTRKPAHYFCCLPQSYFRLHTNVVTGEL